MQAQLHHMAVAAALQEVDDGGQVPVQGGMCELTLRGWQGGEISGTALQPVHQRGIDRAAASYAFGQGWVDRGPLMGEGADGGGAKVKKARRSTASGRPFSVR